MREISFQDLEIKPEISRAISDMGFDKPTEIQEKAIPFLIDSEQDFIGQAQTGTGKTAAFVIPILEKMDVKSDSVQALVLAPTRELALQVEAEIGKLGKYMNVRSTCIYGGAGYDKQIRSLRKEKAQIVVGTPGRVIDMINKGILKVDEAKFCVLDEADEMLNMGFFEDVQYILELFNNKRQLIMFSATMPKTITSLISRSFRRYELVRIEKKSLSNDDIEQKHFVIRPKHFKEALARLIDYAPDAYALVFCKTKIETVEVCDDLRKRGHSVEILNGDMGQTERERAMKNFKEKKATLMVCTDVAARGIDVNNLTHVFNYGLPQDNESYVHRIGRTGRAGMKGKAYTIVGPKSVFAIKKIEKHINKKIEYAKLPKVGELINKVVDREIDGVQDIIKAVREKGDSFEVDSSFDLFKNQVDDLSKNDLMKLMYTWKFNKIVRHYNNLSDIEEHGRPSSRSNSERRRRSPRRRFRGNGSGKRKEGGSRDSGGNRRKKNDGERGRPRYR